MQKVSVVGHRLTGLYTQANGRFKVRKAVPHELRKIVGKDELVRSLRTTSFEDAVRLYAGVMNEFDAILTEAKQGISPTRSTPSLERLTSLAKGYGLPYTPASVVRETVDFGRFMAAVAAWHRDGNPDDARFQALFGEVEKRPRCLIGMEACAGSHDWGRRFQEMGHDLRLMPPSYVKPYVKRGKTDAADTAAICEAVTRPSMRFVAVKSEACSSMLVLHRTLDFLVRQRTQIGNAIRAHMTEFGIIAAKGAQNVDRLRRSCTNCRKRPGCPSACSSINWPRRTSGSRS